jgi:hypothetical protein
MAKYRKKPVIIDAFQMTHFYFDNNAWPDWLKEAIEKGYIFLRHKNSTWRDDVAGKIPTMEGVMEISFSDWVIRGIQNEFYPCKPDIFDQTYELVE